MQPPRDRIFEDLSRELRDGLICPVFIGSAEKGNGIVRLLKALRHEAPFVEHTARRLKLENAKSAAQVIKTDPHATRRQDECRARADRRDSATARCCAAMTTTSASVRRVLADRRNRAQARTRPWPATRSALGRLEKIGTGETLTIEKGGIGPGRAAVQRPEPVYGHRHRAQGPQGRGEAVGGADQADRGRSGPPARSCGGHASDGAVGPRRDAPACRARTA